MWKRINDFPNYEVSDTGQIKNIKTGKYLSPKKSRTGYLRVTLCDNGFQKTILVHRLVAIAFIQSNGSYKLGKTNIKNGLQRDCSKARLLES